MIERGRMPGGGMLDTGSISEALSRKPLRNLSAIRNSPKIVDSRVARTLQAKNSG